MKVVALMAGALVSVDAPAGPGFRLTTVASRTDLPGGQ
jgi:hypothetical protein